MCPGSSERMLSWANPRFKQRHALAGRGQQRPLDRITQRPKAPRVAGNHHLAQRIEQHQAIRAVEPLCHVAHDFDERRPPVARQFAADLVHDDFSVGGARQMVIIVRQQLVAQLGIIRQLAVERETKPFVLLQVVSLERLGVVEVVLTTGGITHVADRRPAGIPLHNAFRFAAVAQPKHLADAAQAAVGFQQLLPVRPVAGHAGR